MRQQLRGVQAMVYEGGFLRGSSTQGGFYYSALAPAIQEHRKHSERST